MSEQIIGRSFRVQSFGQPLQRECLEIPRPAGREVLIRVDRCGLCHSDLHVQDGYFALGGDKKVELAAAGIRLPLALGHEIVGEVAAVGPEVTEVAPGDSRAVYPWIGCGACRVCRAGREQDCAAPRSLGMRRDGGFADYVTVPDPRYLVDYGELSADLAAMSGCSFLTAYSALKKLRHLGAEDSIAVIGAGGGLGLAALSIAAGVVPARIIAVDVSAERLAAARQAGAAAGVPSGDGAAAVVAAAGGQLAGIIDFVGAAATLQLGLDIVARGGTIVSVGLYGGETPLPVAVLALRRLSLLGSATGTLEEMREVVALLRRLPAAPVPLRAVDVEEVNAAMDDLRQGRVIGRTMLRAR